MRGEVEGGRGVRGGGRRERSDMGGGRRRERSEGEEGEK